MVMGKTLTGKADRTNNIVGKMLKMPYALDLNYICVEHIQYFIKNLTLISNYCTETVENSSVFI